MYQNRIGGVASIFDWSEIDFGSRFVDMFLTCTSISVPFISPFQSITSEDFVPCFYLFPPGARTKRALQRALRSRYIYTSVDLSIKWTALEVDSVVEWIRLLRGIDWYSTDRVT